MHFHLSHWPFMAGSGPMPVFHKADLHTIKQHYLDCLVRFRFFLG
jgi:hypothetical protein